MAEIDPRVQAVADEAGGDPAQRPEFSPPRRGLEPVTRPAWSGYCCGFAHEPPRIGEVRAEVNTPAYLGASVPLTEVMTASAFATMVSRDCRYPPRYQRIAR